MKIFKYAINAFFFLAVLFLASAFAALLLGHAGFTGRLINYSYALYILGTLFYLGELFGNDKK